MTDTFTPKELGNGQIANSQTTILTAAASVTTYLKHLSLYNTSATPQTVQLWLKHTAGTARKWKRFVLAQDEQVDVIDPGEAYMLDNGTVVQAMSTTNNVVDWWADGVTEVP